MEKPGLETSSNVNRDPINSTSLGYIGKDNK
jgi:hypothetical protein